MQENYESERLDLTWLKISDAGFILELLNTEGWIKFIGDRNVKQIADAENYIQRIMSNHQITYWTVRLKKDQTAIGVVSFLKRDYLPHFDIGFAFLPIYTGNGYAQEAMGTVLKDLLTTHPTLLATTIPENHRSIRLLTKLGFHFKNELVHEKTPLNIYAIES